MFYFLLDFEADIQGMAEVDKQTMVYITLEALLQIFDIVNSINVRSNSLSPGHFLVTCNL